MMRYSREETIKDFDKASKDIKRLYQEDCINRKGKTNDTDEYYTEIFSEQLLHMKVGELEENISQINRPNYKVGSHSKTVSKNNTNRREENFAKSMLWSEIEKLGEIIDFQIPLKKPGANAAINKGVGKIDLISFNKGKPSAYIIELKDNQNKETLLRAILEIFTYYCQLNKGNFIDSFEEYTDNCLEPENIKKAVLLGKDSLGAIEANELKNRLKLKKLIKVLGVEIFEYDFKVENITL